MEGMSANVRKPARSPEHAVELRQYYKEVHDNVASLKPLIAELPAFYDLLDEFMYLLPDDDDRLRWTTFSWPTKMMAEIVTGEENCDAVRHMPLPCASTAFVAKTVPFLCGTTGRERVPEHDDHGAGGLQPRDRRHEQHRGRVRPTQGHGQGEFENRLSSTFP